MHWPEFTDVDKASEIFGRWVKIKDDHWHHINYLSGSKISSIFEESDSAIKSDQIWPISDQNTRIWLKGNPAHDLTLEETYLQNVRKIWQNCKSDDNCVTVASVMDSGYAERLPVNPRQSVLFPSSAVSAYAAAAQLYYPYLY